MKTPSPGSPTAKDTAAGGVVGRLRSRNEGRENLTALVGDKSCRCSHLTYGELFRMVDEVGAGLMDLGV